MSTMYESPGPREDPDEGLDSGLDPEGPSAEDLDRFGSEFKACPACGSDVFDQSELCQACGYAFEREFKGMPIWAAVTLIVALLAFLVVVLF